MSMEADEDEHSIEMQLPYIAKVGPVFRIRFSLMRIRIQDILLIRIRIADPDSGHVLL